MRVIDDKTFIPLGLAAVLLGGAGWYISIYVSKTEANEKELSAMQIKVDRYQEDVHQVKEGVVRIETKLDILVKGE